MIFLDTSYILGLLLEKDSYHNISRNIESLLADEKKMINITVIQEVLNSLNNVNYHDDISLVVDILFSLDRMEYLSERDYSEAIDLFKYYNKSINFSDCTILQSMQKNNVTNIVSFDSDFDKISGISRLSGF